MKVKINFLLASFIGLICNQQAFAWGFEHNYMHAARYAEDAVNSAGNPGVSRLNIQAQATVAFSPDGGGERIVVDAINAARQRILVQAYGFTDKAILSALAQAKQRGLDVRVILDKSNDRSGSGNESRYSGATYMANAGVPVWIDYKPAIAHNKVMIIDGQEVITGSFNFTTSAQRRNAENVLILNGVPQLADVYTKDWMWRLSESRNY